MKKHLPCLAALCLLLALTACTESPITPDVTSALAETTTPAPDSETEAATTPIDGTDLWNQVLPALDIYRLCHMEGIDGTSTLTLTGIGGLSYESLSGTGALELSATQTLVRSGTDFSLCGTYRRQDRITSIHNQVNAIYTKDTFYTDNNYYGKQLCTLTPADRAEVLEKQAFKPILLYSAGVIPYDSDTLYTPFATLPDGTTARDLFLSLEAATYNGTDRTVITARGLAPAHADASTPWIKSFLQSLGYRDTTSGSLAALLAGPAEDLAKALDAETFSLTVTVNGEGKLDSVTLCIRLAPADRGENIDLTLTVTVTPDTPELEPPADAAAYETVTWREMFDLESDDSLALTPDKDGILTLSDDPALFRRQSAYLFEQFLDSREPTGPRIRARGILAYIEDETFVRIYCPGGDAYTTIDLTDDTPEAFLAAARSGEHVELIFHYEELQVSENTYHILRILEEWKLIAS